MAKVLIVDDDEDILGLVQARLRKADHQVMSAASAAQALQLIDERGQPDLVVLDVGLPGLDGLGLLEAIRGKPGLSAMPAIFLSARVMPEDVAAGRAMGAIYLTKPFVASALLGAVEKALAQAADAAAGARPEPGGW